MSGAFRIVAGVSGSPGSVHALLQAADFARHHDALLVPPSFSVRAPVGRAFCHRPGTRVH